MSRAELICGAADRTKLIAAAGVVAVLLLGALVGAPAGLLASNNITPEEQWVLGL
jgi:hypothetical protein